jgi:hypothetical protein
VSTCPSCRRALLPKPGDYTYKRYGKLEVVLLDVSLARCPCKIIQVTIPYVDDLHLALAAAYRAELVGTPEPVAPDEVTVIWRAIYGDGDLPAPRYWSAEARGGFVFCRYRSPFSATAPPA